MGLDIVLYDSYFRIHRNTYDTSPYKQLHISIRIYGKPHDIKEKHRCFQEMNTIPYAINVHFVLLSFCEYWVLDEDKQETSLQRYRAL